MVVPARLGAGGTDGCIVYEKHIAGAVADNADSRVFISVTGQQVAKDVLGSKPLQDGPGSIEFITDHGGAAFADDTDIVKALVVITYYIAGPELSGPAVQAGEQAFIFFHGYIFK
ncbi:hypothetical protein CBFG_00407 [Clostridiales bacterium 1_7_47FAA]|nr:hypothetical protein CBFG_00407 [Clostridiales bacterium 1_7_47FAA]